MQKLIRMLKKYRTTIFGTGTAGSGAIALLKPEYREIAAALFAICQILLAYFAKDKEATGGTMPVTVEAEARAEGAGAEPSEK